MTVQELIARSLRIIGVINPDTTLLADTLAVANSLLRSYNLDRNKIFTINRAEYTMPSAIKAFTYGPGGQFNGARPSELLDVNLFYQNTPSIVRVPLAILDEHQYAGISLPDMVNVPTKVYYDKGYKQTAVVGTALLYFHPVPNKVYTVEIFATTNLPAMVLLADTLLMPDGYDRMIAINLAREMGPEIGRPWTPENEAIRLEANAMVESNNAPSPIMGSDPALTAGRGSNFDYRTGQPW